MPITSARSDAPDLGKQTGVAIHPRPQSGNATKVTTSRQTTVACLDPLANFYEWLLPVETVKVIYADWHPDGLEVWLIVYRATEADRELIYNHERTSMQAFPGLGVDTRLIDRSKVDPTKAIDLTAVDAFLRFPRSTHA